MQIFKSAFLFYIMTASTVLLLGCGDKDEVDFKPEAKESWEKVMHTHGHHDKRTEMFELNSKAAILHVEADPVEGSYNSNLEVYVTEGSGKLYSNPDLHVFNNAKEDNIKINKKPGKYRLYIKAMAMDYKLKIYEQTKESNDGGKDEGQDGNQDEGQDGSQDGGH